MNKRAGSFFKNVLSKSKNLFNKMEEETKGETDPAQNDFDSEDD
jgi:hypothetical protein